MRLSWTDPKVLSALAMWLVFRPSYRALERVFLFFDNRTIDAARGTWRMLGEREDIERHFWKQEGGRWVEGP